MPDFGPVPPKRRGTGRGRTFKPGGVDRSAYLNAEWGYDLYRILSEEIADMPDFKDDEGITSVPQEVQSREIRNFATVLIDRIDQATGHRGLEGFEKALNEGKIIQVPLTPKEQNFLREVTTYFDLGPSAVEEFSKVPKQGFY